LDEYKLNAMLPDTAMLLQNMYSIEWWFKLVFCHYLMMIMFYK